MLNDDSNNNKNHKHAYAGQVNGFTHLRALSVFHDHGVLVPSQIATRDRQKRWLTSGVR
jgi:hypothetical protein